MASGLRGRRSIRGESSPFGVAVYSAAARRPRSLQTSGCSLQRSENTTFNSNPDVPTYYGIMFSVVADSDLILNGMDVDVRLDQVASPGDLAIRVYAAVGEISNIYGDPSLWTLVANTTAVPAPEGTGAILPAQDFAPVAMAAGERHTFYVTMDKSLLDSTVYALDKTDEVAYEGADLTTFVGVGFTGPDFPGEFDTTVDPQFAGVLYYVPQGATCGTVTLSTEILFDFLFSQQVAEIGDVNQIMTDTLEGFMENIPALQQAQALYSLEITSINTSPQDYTGGCPDSWSGCTTFYSSTSVVFSHLNSLSSGALQFEAYKLAGNVTRAVQQGVTTADVFYIGLESVSAAYEMELDGVPVGATMDDVQSAYFAETTYNFLAQGAEAASVPVFQVSVESQKPGSLGRRRLQATGSSVVTGRMDGAKYHYLTSDKFLGNLQSEFSGNEPLYVNLLKTNGLRPGPINADGGYVYFDGMTSTSASFMLKESGSIFPDVEANGSSGGGGVDASIIAVIAAIAAVGMLIVGCVVFKRLQKMNHDLVKLRDEDEVSDSMIFETVGPKDTNKKEQRDLWTAERPQRRRSFDGATGVSSLDLFITQNQPKANKMSGARSVEELPVSRRGADGAGFAPSSFEHGRRGQRRPQNGGPELQSLSRYIDKQPRASRDHVDGARSIGPGAALGHFLDNQTKPHSKRPGMAQSVYNVPVHLRQSGRSPQQNGQATPSLGPYLDGQSRQKHRKSGAKTVNGVLASSWNGDRRSAGLASLLDSDAARADRHVSGTHSIGPGVKTDTDELRPEEKWGPLPRRPSMRRLVRSMEREPARGVRRVRTMDDAFKAYAQPQAVERRKTRPNSLTETLREDGNASTPPTMLSASLSSQSAASQARDPVRGVRCAQSMDDDLRAFGKLQPAREKKKKPQPPLVEAPVDSGNAKMHPRVSDTSNARMPQRSPDNDYVTNPPQASPTSLAASATVMSQDRAPVRGVRRAQTMTEAFKKQVAPQEKRRRPSPLAAMTPDDDQGGHPPKALTTSLSTPPAQAPLAPATARDREPVRGVRRIQSMDDAFAAELGTGRIKKKRPPPLSQLNGDNGAGGVRKSGRNRGIRLEDL